MRYKNVFFDLDDTLWAFSENACDTFEEMYHTHRLYRYFDSFHHFYEIYKKKNEELWYAYGNGDINKDELNRQRFLYPLTCVGCNDEKLAERYSEDFFRVIPTKKKLMPNVVEVLDGLNSKYNLYILSNGFRELQSVKMQSAAIDKYFKKIILSEDIGLLKPSSQLFYYALSATQSELKDTIMIGDSWSADIVGAHGIGMDQVFYNYKNVADDDRGFLPTYEIVDHKELLNIL